MRIPYSTYRYLIIPMCYIVGPEIAASVQRIFAAAEAPIAWEAVDVTPVRNPDGTMGIPQVQTRPKSK